MFPGLPEEPTIAALSPDKIYSNIFFNLDSSREIEKKGNRTSLRVTNKCSIFSNFKKAYTKKSCIYLIRYPGGIVSVGGGGKFEPRELLCSNRIHEGRIVSTNKEYSTPSPGVSKIVTVGRGGTIPKEKRIPRVASACMQHGRKASIGIHRWSGEFHLYANSKPRCDPCLHLEIPAKRVDPIFPRDHLPASNTSQHE